MQMVLSMRFGILDALFEDLLRLLNELTVQIDRIGRNTSIGVVLSENKLRSLLIVLLHLATVSLSLLGELLGAGAIAVRVGILRLKGVSPVQSNPTPIAIATAIRDIVVSHTRPKHCPRLEAS